MRAGSDKTFPTLPRRLLWNAHHLPDSAEVEKLPSHITYQHDSPPLPSAAPAVFVLLPTFIGYPHPHVPKAPYIKTGIGNDLALPASVSVKVCYIIARTHARTHTHTYTHARTHARTQKTHTHTHKQMHTHAQI